MYQEFKWQHAMTAPFTYTKNMEEVSAPAGKALLFYKVNQYQDTLHGLYPGDLLGIDPLADVQGTQFVLAKMNGELCIKRVEKMEDTFYVHPERPGSKPIEIVASMGFIVVGIIKKIIRNI
ncbi:MAG: S24 family peptidase [Cytophagaceae bacterium]